MTPPGWYPDRQYPALLRWWDGVTWTAHTKPVEVRAPAHAVLPPVVQAQAQTPIQIELAHAEARLVALRRELEGVEEAIEIQSFGFYRPRYGFQRADEYAERLKQIREHQKRLIKTSSATATDTKWAVGGSLVEGQRMMTRMSKLMLRAFNGECDAAISRVRYDNVVTLEQRITKSCEEVNKLGHSVRVEITRPYYELKLAELHLVHEHREKKQAEKEEERRRREELREEQKARDEIEYAVEQSEAEETRYRRELARKRADMEAATGAQHERLAALIAKLETELAAAIDRKARAIARAQMTRSGHVYVLSNVGSFGEGIYKIGLTRRLDPYERVDELGSAAVPFPFDVHAIIFAPDAPALETALHREFASRRVNLVNHRKEYFRVSLEEVRLAVEKLHGLVSFVLAAEAEDWRKTRSILEAGEVGGSSAG